MSVSYVLLLYDILSIPCQQFIMIVDSHRRLHWSTPPSVVSYSRLNAVRAHYDRHWLIRPANRLRRQALAAQRVSRFVGAKIVIETPFRLIKESGTTLGFLSSFPDHAKSIYNKLFASLDSDTTASGTRASSVANLWWIPVVFSPNVLSPQREL